MAFPYHCNLVKSETSFLSLFIMISIFTHIHWLTYKGIIYHPLHVFKTQNWKKKSVAITSFRWWNWVLLEMILNVTVCVCVGVYASQGGCSDSLRLHSSVCIWSRPNEAESLAVVRCICRAKEWWASHSAAVSQGGNTHLRTLPAVCTVILCSCVPMLQKVMPHMLWMPSGRSVWLPHEHLLPPWTGDLTSSETDQKHVFGKFNCQMIYLFFVDMHTSTYNPILI